MNQFLFVFSVVLIGLVAGQQYTTKYDNVDLDQIIKSDRLMKNYVDCVLERGKCTPDGTELKKNLPDALQTDCSKCSEKQKDGSRKILKHLVKNKREWFNELAAKYDPDSSYRKRNEAEFAKEGIVF
ncbi:hypothetical protein NQ315_009639 [Exocentrus adspersus]|uniref:Uncharacterized protein n=1 Tax=Exocentrus adspersus TaxID=1586481 RepID=A0AAV8WGV6_9CUCU|nr:hypothetical protein NQ315_009639 [Exocentrus adspersus]